MDHSPRVNRTDSDLAQMVGRVAQVVGADAILWVTESGASAPILVDLASRWPLQVATVSGEGYDALTQAGLEVIRLPLFAADKYGQVRHLLSVAYRSGSVQQGDLLVCAVGCYVYPGEGDLIVVTDVESSVERLTITDFLRLTDSIRPAVLEATLAVAGKIGRVVRRGSERLGAIFMLGDSLKVLEGSKQLIPNPFHGHDDHLRQLSNPEIHDALVELAKLDGAFVVRGDGFIQSAAVFLATGSADIELPSGLGTRHHSAAAITARTIATAVVVSATDGNVRVFSGGTLVLEFDPDVPYGPVTVG